MGFSFANLLKGILKFILFVISLIIVGALSAYITMNLIIGGKEVKVPDLFSKNIKDAVELLSQNELNLAISETKRYDDKIPVDHIIVQSPEANTMIKKGRKVEVILSMGTEKLAIPSFSEKTERESVIMIQQLDFRVGTVSIISASSQKEGVVAQYPEAGVKVFRGTSIDLLINRGMEQIYVMPDLIGKDLDAVTDFLTKNNMKIGGIKVEDYPGLSPRTIIKQNPNLGFPLKSSEIVSITVSK